MKKTLIFILLIVGLSGCKTKTIDILESKYGTYLLQDYTITDLRNNKSIEDVIGSTTIEIGKDIHVFLTSGSKLLMSEDMKFTEIERNGIITFSNNNEYRGTLDKASGIITFQFNRATIKQGYDCRLQLTFKRFR